MEASIKDNGMSVGKIGLYISLPEIELLKKGRRTYCQPKDRTERIGGADSIQKRIDSIGQIFDVADMEGNIHGCARLVDAFVTTYGNPDSRLLEGYGFRQDTQKFQQAYRAFWEKTFTEVTLEDKTELFAFTYESLPEAT